MITEAIVFSLPFFIIFLWIAHDKITYLALKNCDIKELKLRINTEKQLPKFHSHISFNPEYKLKFPEITNIPLVPERYLHLLPDSYSLKNYLKNHMSGLMSIYSYEPDMGVDDDLILSKFQSFTAGSHGWRHVRFGFIKDIVRLGIAHKMSEHYFNEAIQLKRKRNLYWSTRVLGRALHYIEDIGQPFHAKIISPEILLKHISPVKIGYHIANLHVNFEAIIGFLLWRDKKTFVNILSRKDLLKGRNTESIALRLRKLNMRYFTSLVNLLEKLIPQDFLSTHKLTVLDTNTIETLLKDIRTKRLLEITRQLLFNVGTAIRSTVRNYITY